MPNPSPKVTLQITLDDQIMCIRRELRMREKVFPVRVARRLLAGDVADRELSVMRAVMVTLERLKQCANDAVVAVPHLGKIS